MDAEEVNGLPELLESVGHRTRDPWSPDPAPCAYLSTMLLLCITGERGHNMLVSKYYRAASTSQQAYVSLGPIRRQNLHSNLSRGSLT